MNDERYAIGELAELANVTPRTIRYYTAEGLLPPPITRGRYTVYGADHLRRLRLIGKLKERYLPLHEIKARLAELGADEVEQLANSSEAAVEDEPVSTASSYITQVLQSRSGARQQTPGFERPRAAQVAPPAEARREGAVEKPALRPRPFGYDESYGLDASAPLASVSPRVQPGPPTTPETALRGSIGKIDQAPSMEQWRRVEVSPGVELHVRESQATPLGERIERLIALARELLLKDELGP